MVLSRGGREKNWPPRGHEGEFGVVVLSAPAAGGALMLGRHEALRAGATGFSS
jgi:hypothetical protein